MVKEKVAILEKRTQFNKALSRLVACKEEKEQAIRELEGEIACITKALSPQQKQLDLAKEQLDSIKSAYEKLETALVECQRGLSGLQKKQVGLQDTFNTLIEVKTCLAPLQSEGSTSEEYWYIPALPCTFEQLSLAMSWGLAEQARWQQVNNMSAAARGEGEWGLIGQWLQKTKDFNQRYSPCRLLLEDINTRIDGLKLLQQAYDTQSKQKHEQCQALVEQKGKIEEAKATALELYIESHEQYSETKAALQTSEAALVVLRDECQALTRHWQLHTFYKTLEPVITSLKSVFSNLCDAAPEVLKEQTSKQRYHVAKHYFAQLAQFIVNRDRILAGVSLADIKQAVSTASEKGGIEQVIVKEITQLIKDHDALVDASSELHLRYERLTKECFESHRAEIEQQCKQAEEQARQKQRELQERSLHVDKYLGGFGQVGLFDAYLCQRAQRFWIVDLFSSWLAFFLGTPFGYVTEKQRREQFIEGELKPALVAFKQSGNNDTLKAVLKHAFFKPRATDGAGYTLSLDYFLRCMADELLPTEDRSEFFMCEGPK